ncbi:MAG: twin-arginine translocation signal domain-containing protein, partial [Actinobacteria bacterium]|nr:twin-arginine translocation signal domain-containing protein [Actinomycetota bacterium]
MDGLTRRGFLQASGVVGATALLAGAAGCSWQDVQRAASQSPLPPGTPVLVLVTLYGGNDWLNTVIPVDDPAYHDARPGMSYSHGDVLALDNVTGLNPGLKNLSSLWSSKKLAIMRGVGYPNPDRSHFRSMDIWQTGSPGTPLSTGWLGRWLDHAKDPEPLLGLNIGPVLPVLAVGAQRTFAALSVK